MNKQRVDPTAVSRNGDGNRTPTEKRSNNDDRQKIVVVGHSRAGKSTFLAVLVDAFEQAEWLATVLPRSSDVVGSQGAQATEQQTATQQVATHPAAEVQQDTRIGASASDDDLNDPGNYVRYLRHFLSQGYFPPATPVKTVADRVSFMVRNKHERNKGFIIECHDPAGEVVETYHAPNTPGADAVRKIKESISKSTGVLMLLDPETHPDIWLDTWNCVSEGVAASDRRKPRIAICFAKADTGLRHRRFRVRDALAWVESDTSRKRLLDRINTSRLESKWFFISAAGWVDGSSNTRVFVDAMKIRLGGAHSAVALNTELVPDPARVTDPVQIASHPGNARRMRSLPVFTDPMRFSTHDCLNNPITVCGPIRIMRENAAQEVPRLHGVHVGFGRAQDQNRSRVQPWNVVEPMLWLAGYRLGAR